MKKWAFFVFSVLMAVLIGCSQATPQQQALEETGLVQARRSSPELAAARAFELWAKTPYSNEQFSLISNDGTFATVYIKAEFRETADSSWIEGETTVECRKIGGGWECDTEMLFYPVAEALDQTQNQKFALYVQNVVTGGAAIQRLNQLFRYETAPIPVPKEGWQLITFDLIIENISPKPLIVREYHFYGTLIDSGGFEHRIQEGLGIPPHLFVPGIRYRFPIKRLQIPANQTPATAVFNFEGQQFVLDMTSPQDSLAVPFDSLPSSIPIATDGVFEFSIPGEYRLKYTITGEISDNRYHENVTYPIMLIEAENFGGRDLAQYSVSSPIMAGVTDQGALLGGIFTPFVHETVPPGFIKTSESGIFGGYQPGGTNWGDYNWMWIAMLPNENEPPVAQFLLVPPNLPTPSWYVSP